MSNCWLLFILYEVFPPIESWIEPNSDNSGPDVSEYEEKIEDYLQDFSGDEYNLLGKVEQSHFYELERGSELDSKAENYIRNMGFVLGILSLTPVLMTITGINEQEIVVSNIIDLIIFTLFLFGVTSLFSSVYYSSKSLQLREYNFNYTSDSVEEELQNGEYPKEKLISHLLYCKSKNEDVNNKKALDISIAQRLSRNGLISIGILIVTISVIVVPIELSLFWV